MQIKVRPLPPQEPGPGIMPRASPYDTGQVQHFVASVFPGSLLLEQHQVILIKIIVGIITLPHNNRVQ